MPEWVNPVALATLLTTWVAFAALWLLSVQWRNTAVVDLYWAPGFVVIALIAKLAVPGPATAVGWIMFACVAAWAARLGMHMTRRFFADGHEDPRYAKIRAEAGPHFWWSSLFTVFTLQALILWMIATPVLAVYVAPAATTTWALVGIGLVLFAVGFVVEAIADAQLARHRADPANKGRTLTSGIWAWSRRPNYLGEALVWTGLSLVAAAGSTAWWLVVGPLVLIAILVGLTGRMTEAYLVASRPDYADYMRRVPYFLPKPPARPGVSPAE